MITSTTKSALRKMSKRSYSESALQKEVIQYIRLQYPHTLAFHVPNGGKREKWEAAHLKRQGVLAGVSDILIFWLGGMGAIELKAGKNTTTPQQDYFGDKWEWAGGFYEVCRSVDEVASALKRWGVK